MAGLGLYLRISVDLPDHPKFIQAGPAAAWFWQAGLGYSKKHKTDGFIPAAKLSTLVPGVSEREAKKLAAKLVEVRLWLTDEHGYRVKDYLHYNPSRAELESDAERKRNEYRRRRGDIAGDTGGESTGDGVGEKSGEQAGEIDGDARLRDHAHGSGSDSGDVSALVSSSSEGGPGETNRKPLISGMSSPMGWARIHGSHVTGFCGTFVCFPESVFEDFVTRVTAAGTSRPDAEAQVMRWAVSVREAWAGQIPGDDIFEFWRNEWRKTHGSNKTTAAAGRDVTAGLRQVLR